MKQNLFLNLIKKFDKKTLAGVVKVKYTKIEDVYLCLTVERVKIFYN